MTMFQNNTITLQSSDGVQTQIPLTIALYSNYIKTKLQSEQYNTPSEHGESMQVPIQLHFITHAILSKLIEFIIYYNENPFAEISYDPIKKTFEDYIKDEFYTQYMKDLEENNYALFRNINSGEKILQIEPLSKILGLLRYLTKQKLQELEEKKSEWIRSTKQKLQERKTELEEEISNIHKELAILCNW